MFTAFDRIVIDVPDLAEAITNYGTLLGSFGEDGRLDLGNVSIVLRAGKSDRPGITSLNLLDTGLASGAEQALPTGARAIPLLRSNYRDPQYRKEPTATGVYAVDHIVLQTRDADDCIRLFRDELGLRLALDQTVPEFGGRMLFFRLGKMTLEVIQRLENPPEHDFFWGITYLCHDIDATVDALDRRGVAHSPIRAGRKPGTRVATIRDHCLDLPTLLIAPA